MSAPQPTPTPKVHRIVSTTTTWELTSEQIEDAIRRYVGAPAHAEVDFDVGQVLRGATVCMREVE